MEIFSEVIDNLNDKISELEKLQEQVEEDVNDAIREIHILRNEKHTELVELVNGVIDSNNIDLEGFYINISNEIEEALNNE